MLLAIIAFSSCEEPDPTPMKWEFSNYDSSQITPIYAPEFYTQVQINAKPDYKGDILVQCTNFQALIFHESISNEVVSNTEYGFSISKENANTLRISFVPIKKANDNRAYVGINGINEKETAITNMSITRFNE